METALAFSLDVCDMVSDNTLTPDKFTECSKRHGAARESKFILVFPDDSRVVFAGGTTEMKILKPGEKPKPADVVPI